MEEGGAQGTIGAIQPFETDCAVGTSQWQFNVGVPPSPQKCPAEIGWWTAIRSSRRRLPKERLLRSTAS